MLAQVDAIGQPQHATPQRVRDLEFSDLYLGHPTLGNRLADVPGAPANPVVAGPELAEDLAHLITLCQKEQDCSPGGTDFKVEYDGVFYRVAVMRALGGDVFVMRRISKMVADMRMLGIPEHYQKLLMAPNMTGLLLIAGAMKSGKTSTACALIRQRLEAYGGVAVTAEDPIELPLEGAHGPGVCYQTYARRDSGGFAESARHIVRWGAKIIFLGEIRDGEVAAEALRAGINGHLVISTIHTDSVLTTMRRIQAMAAESFDPATANALLADGLAGIFHQRLIGDPRRLSAEVLMVKGEASVVSAVRGGQFERLDSEVKLQMANIIQYNSTKSAAQRVG